MNTKNPSEFFEHLSNFSFVSNSFNIYGFNSECLLHVSLKIENGKYKIEEDAFAPITPEEYKFFLENNDFPYAAKEDMNARERREYISGGLLNESKLEKEPGWKPFYSAASRIKKS